MAEYASGPAVAPCATAHEHWFEIRPGADVAGAVTGIALHCPNCPPSSPAEELREMVAARRRTLTGLAGLPAPVRAELAASGTLGRIYGSTVAEVREAVERCGVQLGVRPPAGLTGVPGPRPSAEATPPGGTRRGRAGGPGHLDGSGPVGEAGHGVAAEESAQAEAAGVLDAATDWVSRLSRA
ncbi:MAG TPA: hypothetical protein VGH99_10115 [Pseudonocardia sp.]